MLRFSAFENGKPASKVDISGAYLLGGDGIPVRAEIDFKKGEIICKKRASGPAALSVLCSMDGGARVMLQTTRLPEREKPYVLQAELMRGRLMHIAQKREDWGLYTFEGLDDVSAQIEASRDMFIKALQAKTPAEAASIADKGMAMAVVASEQLTAFHAEIFFSRRKMVGGFPPRLFGCTVDPTYASDDYLSKIPGTFDFVSLPFLWKLIEPSEKEINWDYYDRLVKYLSSKGIPIRGSSLVNFTKENVPDWLHIWEHDFDTIRDLTNKHIRRVVERYCRHIQTWDVISGIHGENCMSFTFEQLMELTRMSTAVVKQLDQTSTVVIDLVAPWGEYYATNQRTIPPMMYADMAVQSGIDFDAFGVQLYFGVGVDGMYVRDIFQISSMLDRFANFGKPVHITGVQVPSDTAKDSQDAWGGKKQVLDGGAWHRDWSEETQRAWLRRVYHIALSKPFVESITWRDLGDSAKHLLPHGGLLRPDRSAKPAYKEIQAIRAELKEDQPRSAAGLEQ